MTAPKGHRIVTVERQGGYAVHCEVECDGAVYPCDVTFGAFATRSEAREALTHDEDTDTQGVARGGPGHERGRPSATRTATNASPCDEFSAVHDSRQARGTSAISGRTMLDADARARELEERLTRLARRPVPFGGVA
ncbi:hypothetical protein [Microbacterium enclense]|uniref:hypothetical protein n=1 Tax=Microbacterium enclense TaxID=993073 RepID=UPI003F7F266D